MPRKLSRSFYARPALDVAPELLGKILVHEKRGVLTAGRIVEVEAYLGADDPASHAYRGLTPRNRVMFGDAGYAYVYFTYGNHFCMNVVTGKKGEASAVLIRALEPLKGIPTMQRRRKKEKLQELTSGPGKLAAAMAIDRRCYGLDLRREPLYLLEDPDWKESAWVQTPRIGLRVATEMPYRYLIPTSPYLSKRYYPARP